MAYKRDYHGWLIMMTSSEGPLFSLASGPPTLNPPLCVPGRFFTKRYYSLAQLNHLVMSDVLEQTHNPLAQFFNLAHSLTTKANHSSFTQLPTVVTCYNDTVICSKQFRCVITKISYDWKQLVLSGRGISRFKVSNRC